MMAKFFNTDDIKMTIGIITNRWWPAGLAAGIYAGRDIQNFIFWKKFLGASFLTGPFEYTGVKNLWAVNGNVSRETGT